MIDKVKKRTYETEYKVRKITAGFIFRKFVIHSLLVKEIAELIRTKNRQIELLQLLAPESYKQLCEPGKTDATTKA